jgi:hypothetical protein
VVFPLVSPSVSPFARWLPRLVFAAALGLAASPARAQRAADDPEVLIKDGVALRKQGEDAKAHGYFQRAYDLAHTPRTAAQLGLCDLAVGRWIEAEVHLGESLDSSDPWVNNQRAALDQGRAKARAKLGKVVISGAAPGSTVTATGRPPTRLADDGQVWVAPGSVHVKVEAPGFRSVEQDVVVAEGRRAAIDVMMPPVRKEAPPADEAPRRLPAVEATPTTDELVAPAETPSRRPGPRPRRDDGAAWRTPVIWTAAGLSAAMLGFGIYETIEYNSRIDAFNDTKRSPQCGDSGGLIAGGIDCQRLATEGDRAKVLSIVGYVGAGALALTAVIIGLTGGSPSAETDVASSSLSCSPAQGNGMQAGVHCALRF